LAHPALKGRAKFMPALRAEKLDQSFLLLVVEVTYTQAWLRRTLSVAHLGDKLKHVGQGLANL
jgi:hypothetical protein